MLASLLLDSIRSAFNALDRSKYSQSYEFSSAKCRCQLKNLEIFVLCARKLDNDAQLRFDDKVSTFGSLLQRIHDAVSRFTKQLPSQYYWKIERNFQSDTNDIKEEIGHWYNTSDSLWQPTCLHEATEIIDTVLEALHYLRYIPRQFLLTERRAMLENLTFLRNFIRFVNLLSVEPRQLENLLVHIQAVSISTAQISYNLGKETPNAPNDLPLLQKINNMIDPGGYDMYTQVLNSSKLSTDLHSPTPGADHDPLGIMRDFIDSLLSKLWKRLQMDTRIEISTRVQPQLPYEGLRLLRCMLKEQQNKFDEEVRDLTRVVICDTAVLTFLLNQKDVEAIAVSVSDLMKRIDRIRQEVEGKGLSDLMQRFNLRREEVEENHLPRTNELGFMDFLLENLVEMTSSKPCYGFQTQFQMIHHELSSLRCSLGKIEEVHNQQKELETFWNAGIKVTYRVEFLIDQLVLGDFQGSSSASFDFSVRDILEEIKSTNLEIHHAADVKVKKESKTSNLPPARSSSVVPITDEIVGFDDGVTTIINRLTRGSKQLKTVAIVGMPGIGKTTLATKVFNDPSLAFHFHKRAWCCVSQFFDRKKVLTELLKHIDPNGNFEMGEHDLADMIRRRLKGERYLIFFDDVWDIEVWNCLRASFPNDSCGSRIMLTSRHSDVGRVDEEPHFVHQLSDDESWELLQKKLAPVNNYTLELYEVGKQIAANCKGLPLKVVVVAGLIANMDAQGWKEVLENITSVSGSDDHCLSTLELSYKHLPEYLKPCFLYFGLFPDDHEVSVKRLIRLWIAEGFVLKTESKSLEDVARGYMMDLVGRSLVIVSKKRSIGGVKACRIHDLLHDFCRIKAREENFFSLLKGGYDELLSFEEPSYMRRLCIHSQSQHFKYLRLCFPHTRSLLFFARGDRGWGNHDISFVIPRYKHLRVMDIVEYRFGGIPSEIGVFLQLKYLSLWCDTRDITPSIGSLASLETLILDSDKIVSLPDTFWNLRKLRHLATRNYFRFPTENLEDFPDLYGLQSCSCASMDDGDSIERVIRKFPNIRRLGCRLPWAWEDDNGILGCLSRLESLHVSGYSREGDCPMPEFYLLKNLRKLALDHLWLHQSEISMIGQLPNLEVLKLERVNFHGKTWEMVEGEFSTLKFLRLKFSNIVSWRGSEDDQFPCLEKLALHCCFFIKVIDFCFADINTVEMIEVSHCSASVTRFFKRIQDEQMGNLDVKILIPITDVKSLEFL